MASIKKAPKGLIDFLVTFAPSRPDLPFCIEDTAELEGLAYVANGLLCSGHADFPNRLGASCNLEFVVDPRHEAEVAVPSVDKAVVFHEEPFGFHYPRLADERTGRLEQRVEC